MLAGAGASAPAFAADKPPLVVTVGAGVQYDSNVSIDDADISFHRGDEAALVTASAKYSIIDNRKATLRIGYDYDATFNKDITDYDLQLHSGSVNSTLRVGKVILGADYQFTHVVLGGDPYLELHIASPSAGTFAAKRLFVRGAFTYLRKNFLTGQRLDANTGLISLDAFRFYGKRKGYLALGLRRDAEKAAASEYSYHALQGSVRASIPFTLLGAQSKAKLSYTYGERDYRDIYPSIGEKRREKRSTWSAAMEIGLTKSLTLKPQVRYVDRESNVPVFDYREHVVSTMLTYQL